jgi:hypothetical protein
VIQMTDRDEAALDWLGTVRIADMEAVRWVLGALNGSRDPVTLRKAQRWVARMKEVGAVDSGRPTFRDGSLLWSTHAWTGESRPNLYRQTTRHEVAVSIAAARFLAHGYTWESDRYVSREEARRGEHRADGLASGYGRRVLVEVELTPKTPSRLDDILKNHVDRKMWAEHRGEEAITDVVYLAEPAAARGLRRQLREGPDHAHIQVLDVFDPRGKWRPDAEQVWPKLSTVDTYVSTVLEAAAGPNLWTGQ